MTLEELHAIKEFGAIFSDPRLKAALTYLREHPNPKRNSNLSEATAIIRSEGAWHGWFEAIEALEALANAPNRPLPFQRGPAYQQPPNHTAT